MEFLKKETRSKKAIKNATKVVKRGNILMLAIGLLLGTSFNAVVASLANDVIMAAIAKLYGKDSIDKLEWNGILYGKFLAALISFLIITIILVAFLFIIYYIVEIVKECRQRKQKIAEVVEEKPAEPTDQQKMITLLETNNTLLKQQIALLSKAHNVEILSNQFGDKVVEVPFDAKANGDKK
ncbi:MscL family protein [Mycoplasma sp. E35C]|uniref:large conductance mechanosensitive channel protein MscL n=1 Tax=Mycoplasma sp. E35C TaxID=2801918 RepID=UPI001CA465CE|nr:MscL family protein [Mycoplasma sp. E35C]QZX48880.1 MscL family protein [Mycoplasma sp. E35C]